MLQREKSYQELQQRAERLEAASKKHRDVPLADRGTQTIHEVAAPATPRISSPNTTTLPKPGQCKRIWANGDLPLLIMPGSAVDEEKGGDEGDGKVANSDSVKRLDDVEIAVKEGYDNGAFCD